MAEPIQFSPRREDVINYDGPETLVPISIEIPLGTMTVEKAYLSVSRGSNSFLMEFSYEENTTQLAEAVIGTEPCKQLRTGPNEDFKGDPVPHLQREIKNCTVPKKFELKPPILNGAAVGYMSYDCVRYFEPKVNETAQQPDELNMPESLLLFMNNFVYLNYEKKIIKIVALCALHGDREKNYTLCEDRINQLKARLGENVPFPQDGDLKGCDAVSNIGKEKYMEYVRLLKERIVDGDITQAVPSQRLLRKTGVHPLNIYRHLRDVNPSRYMFYMDFADFYLVGSSPELLVKVMDRKIYNHPIAGTRKRGKNEEEDKALEAELLGDIKETSEHIMLVDLGRNDVNRICIPESLSIDSLMHVERYSHVMHIVSQISGKLRPECTEFDAFKSIFPAGTVSGSPKVRAMQLIAKLEVCRRNVYAGAVGYFSYNKDIDTCIAIRTITYKDGVAYLQAGGGIVYDSLEEDEHQETINKMKALAKAITVTEANPVKQSTYKLKPSTDAGDFNAMFSTIPVTDLPQQTTKTTVEKTEKKLRLLMIDNYDSFTYNLYEYLCKLGLEVLVYRNDEITLKECQALNPDLLCISPGPGWPKDCAVGIDAIKAFQGKIPILGVCLGHQAITEIFGGEVVHCGEIVHGKTSPLTHDGKGVFKDIPQNIKVIRYHSLVTNKEKVPKDFIVTSETAESKVIMGIRHKTLKICGVQFHPESIKTEYGMEMFKNFIDMNGSGAW